MGSVLLAIVDIGHGIQPFYRSHGGEEYVGVFNGEIYNYIEIRNELESAGLQFETNCDTEVALAAFAFWGDHAVRRFDGQWALAVWARRGRSLFLSRDPLGIKPLFFFSRGQFFAFASEPKALFAHPGIPRRPNIVSIQDYFLHGLTFAAGYSLNHRSFYEGVDSLPPGTSLTWRKGKGARIERYFDYPLETEFQGNELADVSDALAEELSTSIEASMMGDAPLGVALSGGVDSSIIAAVAAKRCHCNSSSPLLASCIRYRGQPVNEDAAHAALLTEYLGSDAPLHLVFSEMDVASYLDDVDLMIHHFDEPHWEVKQLAMFNNYRKLKQEGAKVVMTGEGSDELFFGYYHRFPGFKAPPIRSPDDLRRHWSARIPIAAKLFAGGTKAQLEERMVEAIDRFYRPYYDREIRPDRVMQCWYLATFLHWLLIDNDRCSMAFSLEGRFPFLNRRVFELALRIPLAAQIGDDLGEEKLVLRRAFCGLLPEQISRHRKKSPMPSPLLLDFHRRLRDGLAIAIEEISSDFWNVISREGAEVLLNAYSDAIGKLESVGQVAEGGEALTRYLRLDENWAVRTPQIFGLLTLIRWWKLNFS